MEEKNQHIQLLGSTEYVLSKVVAMVTPYNAAALFAFLCSGLFCFRLSIRIRTKAHKLTIWWTELYLISVSVWMKYISFSGIALYWLQCRGFRMQFILLSARPKRSLLDEREKHINFLNWFISREKSGNCRAHFTVSDESSYSASIQWAHLRACHSTCRHKNLWSIFGWRFESEHFSDSELTMHIDCKILRLVFFSNLPVCFPYRVPDCSYVD